MALKLFLILVVGSIISSCTHFAAKEVLVDQGLVGVYEGREVVDTEERITLLKNGSFTYDFIPLGQGGESYNGRWRASKGEVVLTGKLQNGDDEDFHLEIGSEKGLITLTYSWKSQELQRATMLIPNVFVRAKISDPTASKL